MNLLHCSPMPFLCGAMQGIIGADELEFLRQQERPTFGVAACITYIVHAAELTNEQVTAMDLDIRSAF